MALQAVTLYGECAVAIVACAACGTSCHLIHGSSLAVAIREELGVAIAALVDFCVKCVAEVAGNGAITVFERQRIRLHAFVAFITVTGGCKSNIAVVTGAAGFTFGHVIHGGIADNCFEWEYFCMAIFAAIYASM